MLSPPSRRVFLIVFLLLALHLTSACDNLFEPENAEHAVSVVLPELSSGVGYFVVCPVSGGSEAPQRRVVRVATIGEEEELGFIASSECRSDTIVTVCKLDVLRRLDLFEYDDMVQDVWKAIAKSKLRVLRTPADCKLTECSPTESIEEIRFEYSTIYIQLLRSLTRLPRLSRLVFSCCECESPEFYTQISNLPHLTALEVAPVGRGMGPDVHLAKCQLLESLVLRDADISVPAAEAIRGLPKLRRLDIARCTLMPGAIESIVGNQALRSIHLRGCQPRLELAFSMISKSKIQALEVESSQLDAQSISALAGSRALESIDIVCGSGAQLEPFRRLLSSSSLRKVRIAGAITYSQEEWALWNQEKGSIQLEIRGRVLD